MDTILNSWRVHEIYRNCLLKDGEDPGDYIEVGGSISVKFHSDRLIGHKAEIRTMLDELPDKFKRSGGDSFLNARNDKHGNQWTSVRQQMEELFQLGIAIGKIKYIPPSAGEALLRDAPYYEVN